MNIFKHKLGWVVATALLLIAAGSGPVITRIRDLNDVRLQTTPTDGDVLTYKSATKTWTNGALGSGTIDAVLTNVTLFGTPTPIPAIISIDTNYTGSLSTYTQYYMDYTATNYFSMLGSAWQRSSNYPGLWEAQWQTGANGSNSAANLPALTLGFGISGNEFILHTWGKGQYPRINVDGVEDLDIDFVNSYAKGNYHLPSDGNEYYVRVILSTNHVNTSREIQIKGVGQFIGVYVPTTNAVTSGRRSPQTRVAILADSFLDYSGNTTFANVLSLMHPQLDIWKYGEGGTGWANTNIGSGYTNFLGRWPDLTNANAPYVIFWGGINDSQIASNTVYAAAFKAATNFVARLSTTTKYMVVGPYWPRTANDVNALAARLAISNAVVTAGLIPPINFLDPQGDPNWVTGLYSTPGSGTAVQFTSSDGTHPTQLGNINIARRVSEKMGQIWPELFPGGQASVLAASGIATLSGLTSSSNYTENILNNSSIGTSALFRKRGVSIRGSNDWFMEPSVIYETNPKIISAATTVFKGWFSAQVGSDTGIRYGESTNGLNWQMAPTLLLTNIVRSFVFTNAGAYYLIGVPSTSRTNFNIYLSASGTNFTPHMTNTITIGGTLGLIGGEVGNSTIWIEGTTNWSAIVECSSAFGAGAWKLCYLTSLNGSNWVAAANNPIVAQSDAMGGYLGGPHVIVTATNRYLMVTHANAEVNGVTPTDIYLWTSVNRTNWTLNNRVPIIARSTSDEGAGYRVGQVADPHLVEAAGVTYLFYDALTNGNFSAGASIKMATSSQSISNIYLWTSNEISIVTGNLGVGTMFPTDKVSIRNGGIDFHAPLNDYPHFGIDFDRTGDTLEFWFNPTAVPLSGNAFLRSNAMTIARNTGIMNLTTPFMNFNAGASTYSELFWQFSGASGPRIRTTATNTIEFLIADVLVARITSGGFSVVAGGYASTSTNTLTVSAGGLTNNTALNYLVSVTAGTGLTLKDSNGTTFLVPVLNNSFPLKPGWRLAGTAVTGIAVQSP